MVDLDSTTAPLLSVDVTRDRYASVRKGYEAAQNAVLRGASVLAMVDYPAALNFRRNRIQLIDVPGFASPPPGMKYFIGVREKLLYLRKIGFDYILAVDPEKSECLYKEARWVIHAKYSPTFLQVWSSYFLDWFRNLGVLTDAATTSVTEFGSLWLFNVEAALKKLEKQRKP